MVKPFDTPIAYGAMTGAISAHNLTIWAQKDGVKYFHKVHKVNIFWLFQIARILAQKDHVKENCEAQQRKLGVD